MARTPDSRPEPTLTTGAGDPMTPEQASLLRQLAHDARDFEAFGEHLTKDEAARRIATLQAKLKLQGSRASPRTPSNGCRTAI